MSLTMLTVQNKHQSVDKIDGRWSGTVTVQDHTTEQNRIERTGKSEAKVTNSKKLRLNYCTIEANY